MSKVAKAAIGLMAATLVAKSLGFGREITLASAYGASSISDAFLVAMNIPAVIFTAIGTSLGTAFIPLFCEVRSKDGDDAAVKYTNNIFNAVVIICVIIAIIGAIFAPEVVKLFALGFKGETMEKAVYFTRIMILGIPFLGISYIMMAFLQVRDNFIIPGLMSVPYNALIIISILLSVKTTPYILPYGAIIGLLGQFVFQLPFAIKRGYRYIPYVNFKDEYLRKMLYLVGPVLIGVAVTQINTIVDRTIASTLVEGSISALSYANKLNQFVMGMFIVSISSVVYPMLSKLSTENNKVEFNKSIVTAFSTVILLVIPISVGAIILSTPIVKILFQRGAFDERATYMTSIALIFYSIGMIGFGLRDILGKVFYSLQDTKTPMINGAIAMILNIILNISFVKFTNMQLAGLALATSTSALVTVSLLFINLRIKIGPFGGRHVASVFLKTLLSALIMGVVTSFAYENLATIIGSGKIQEIITLAIAIGFGALVYSVCVIVLKIEEVNLILNTVKKKLKRS